MSALFLKVYLQSFRRQWKCVVRCPLNIQCNTVHSSVPRNRWKLRIKMDKIKSNLSPHLKKNLWNLPLLINCRIFSMIIWMHLYVTGAYINFITIGLQAMVMRLLPIMRTIQKLWPAIITGRKSQKPVSQTIVTFFMPLVVSTYFFFFTEHFAPTNDIVAMVMFTNIFGNALFVIAVQEWLIFLKVLWSISCKCKRKRKTGINKLEILWAFSPLLMKKLSATYCRRPY